MKKTSAKNFRNAEADEYVEPGHDVAPAAQSDVMAFAEAILHGDDEHRAWLLEAAAAFGKGQTDTCLTR